MPEQYEWGLWYSSTQKWLPHSYVYRRDMTLQAGTTYHFQTRNLTSGWFGRPDPVMYLVRGNDIVGFNDDYTGLASEIIYTPTVTGTYKVVIRAFTTSTPGYCDLYRGEGGAPPSLLESGVMFGGTYIWARWKLGEWFETGGIVLEFVTGEGSPAQTSCRPLPIFDLSKQRQSGARCTGTTTALETASPRSSPRLAAPGPSSWGRTPVTPTDSASWAWLGRVTRPRGRHPAPWASVAEPVTPAPTVTKYIEELARRKPALEELSPGERDQSRPGAPANDAPGRGNPPSNTLPALGVD